MVFVRLVCFELVAVDLAFFHLPLHRFILLLLLGSFTGAKGVIAKGGYEGISILIFLFLPLLPKADHGDIVLHLLLPESSNAPKLPALFDFPLLNDLLPIIDGLNDL